MFLAKIIYICNRKRENEISHFFEITRTVSVIRTKNRGKKIELIFIYIILSFYKNVRPYRSNLRKTVECQGCARPRVNSCVYK